MQGSAKQDLLHRVEGGSSDGTEDDKLSDGALRSHNYVVNFLLHKYADDVVICTTDAAINEIKQKKNQSPLGFKDIIIAKTSLFGRVYSQVDRIHRFPQGLNDVVHNKVLCYFCKYPRANLNTLSR